MTALIALLERLVDRALLALLIFGTQQYAKFAAIKPGEEAEA